jgi:Tol biopolymer transport system component
MNADGSALTKVGTIKSFFARFSPDGKKIAYVSGKFPETAIYIANIDGSGVMKVTK